MTATRLWTGLDGQLFTGKRGTVPTGWQKFAEKDSYRRADGAMVHHIVGGGGACAAVLAGRKFLHVIRDEGGKNIRRFADAPAAMAWLDAEHPVSTGEKVNAD